VFINSILTFENDNWFENIARISFYDIFDWETKTPSVKIFASSFKNIRALSWSNIAFEISDCFFHNVFTINGDGTIMRSTFINVACIEISGKIMDSDFLYINYTNIETEEQTPFFAFSACGTLFYQPIDLVLQNVDIFANGIFKYPLYSFGNTFETNFTLDTVTLDGFSSSTVFLFNFFSLRDIFEYFSSIEFSEIPRFHVDIRNSKLQNLEDVTLIKLNNVDTEYAENSFLEIKINFVNSTFSDNSELYLYRSDGEIAFFNSTMYFRNCFIQNNQNFIGSETKYFKMYVDQLVFDYNINYLKNMLEIYPTYERIKSSNFSANICHFCSIIAVKNHELGSYVFDLRWTSLCNINMKNNTCIGFGSAIFINTNARVFVSKLTCIESESAVGGCIYIASNIGRFDI
jgi:hypothetical protein